MAIHRLHCQDPWFTLIKNGIKPIEGRKNLAHFANWKPGDTLVFFLDDESFQTTIKELRRYETLEEYLQTETLARTLPGVTSIEDGVQIYLQWSTREEIKRVGFLAIEVSLS